MKQYPRDYLFRLECANITKDKGNGPEAIASYKAVIEDGHRPNLFVNPRLQLAYFGLADTLRGQNHLEEARGRVRKLGSTAQLLRLAPPTLRAERRREL